MGAYNSVYIGIYLEVKNGKKVEKRVSYVDENGGKVKSKFNPTNGKENKKLIEEVEVEDYASPNGIDDGDFFGEEEFFNPEYSGGGKSIRTWIPNGFSLYSDSDVFNLEIDADIDDLKSSFMEKYKDYLKVVGEKYEYEVKFGVVHYAH